MPRRAALALLSLLVAALPAFALYDPKPDATLAVIEGEWPVLPPEDASRGDF